MKAKIVSATISGEAGETRIVLDDGRELDGVRSISVSADVDGLPVITISAFMYPRHASGTKENEQ